MPTRILHLLGTAQSEGRGIASFVGTLAGALDPAEFDVHAWFLGRDGPLVAELRAAGAAARAIDWWHGIRDPAGACRFWRDLRRHRFAVVHQHVGARSIRWLNRLAGDARLVVHIWGMFPNAAGGCTAPLALHGADAVVTASRAIAEQIPQLTPTVIYAGVTVPPLTPADRTVDQSAPIIGTACRLVPLKGLIDLIGAVASLCTEFTDLRLEIAGSGEQIDDLRRETDHLALADRVRFLGWQRDLLPCFRRWSIFAMPSLDEGFGMAALEAMAAGLPVVATTVGGLPELVEDGRTGFLVPPASSTALAARLRILLADPARGAAMGAAGRDRVRDCFSVNRMVAETAAFYRRITREPTGAPR